MLRLINSGFLVLFGCCVFAQEIKVVNEYLEPLDGVEIYTSTKSAYTKTSYKGVANLDGFKNTDTLLFFKPGYNFYTTSLDKLLINGYWVTLTLADYTLPSFETSTLREKKRLISDQSLEKESITEEKLIESNAQTTADVLTNASSITIQKSQGGGGSPIIRGFEANRVLLVIDGVRMNNAIYRSGHLQNSITLDNNILSQIDIEYGPGSVIYGSDAIGGVVHFQTKDPLFSHKDSISYNGSFLSRFNSANKEKTNHFDFSFGNDKWGSLSSFTISHFDDIKMGGRRFHNYENWGYNNFYTVTENGVDSVVINSDSLVQKGTGFDQYHLLQKLVFKPNDNLQFKLNVQYSTSSKINRYDRLNNLTSLGTPEYSQWYYGPQNRLLSSFTVEFTNYNSLYDKGIIVLSHQKIDEDRFTRPFGEIQRSIRKEDVAISAINIDFVKAIDSTSKFYYGGELVYNAVSSRAYKENSISLERLPESTRYPDGGSSLSSSAFYVNYKKRINRLNIEGGFRFSHILLNANFNDTSFINLPFETIKNNNLSLNGSLKAAYSPTKQTSFNICFSSGFRAPNIDDFGKVFKKDLYVVVPNAELKSEQAYCSEVGFVQLINTNKSTPLLVLKGALYGTYLDNAIIRSDFSLNGMDSILFDGVLCKVRTNTNAESAFVYGATGTIRLNMSKFLSFRSSLCYSVGTISNSNEPFAHIPPLFGRTRVVYEKNKWDIEFFSEYNGWKRINQYASGSVDNPAEATIDGNPSWYNLNIRLGFEVNSLAQLQFAAYNLMDAHYKTFASGISAPGRAFMISIRSTF